MSGPRRRSLSVTVAAIALVGWLAGCGVPGDGSFRRINPPPELAPTTTTTAVPMPTPTLAPTSTTAPTTSTTEAPTTSTNPVYNASIYFVTMGSELTPITRQLASSAAQQVLTELASGVPAGDEYAGLSSAIPEGTELVVTTASGLATVELPPTFLTDIPPQSQTTAVAQIVLTLTSRPGIGQVRFAVDGEPREVPRGNGAMTNGDDVVACEDYSDLLAPGTAACP